MNKQEYMAEQAAIQGDNNSWSVARTNDEHSVPSAVQITSYGVFPKSSSIVSTAPALIKA